MTAPLLFYSAKLITVGPWLVEVQYTLVVGVGNNDRNFSEERIFLMENIHVNQNDLSFIK